MYHSVAESDMSLFDGKKSPILTLWLCQTFISAIQCECSSYCKNINVDIDPF